MGMGREGVFGSLPFMARSSVRPVSGDSLARICPLGQTSCRLMRIECRFAISGVPCNTFITHPATPLDSGAANRSPKLARQLFPVHFQFHLCFLSCQCCFVGLIGALLFAIGFWVGRVGRVRRVGHLIFKKKMPESFAHERCLDHPMRNSMREAPCRWYG